MKDFAGNELEVGMRVIYLTSGTSSSWMTWGTIIALTPQKVRLISDEDKKKGWTHNSTLRFPDGVVVPMHPELQDFVQAENLRANLTN